MINEQDKKIAIVGGGIAGMQAANVLGRLGYQVSLFEKGEQLGGNVRNWSYLFPHHESANDVISRLQAMLRTHSNIKVLTATSVDNLDIETNKVILTLPNGKEEFDAVILASGFQPFDATKKEEYGYGVFDHVITSVDFEYAAKNETLSKLIPQGKPTIGFVHCVGSRDEKVCNEYCSKACCVTAIKQAIEAKKMNPQSKVYCFYMDLRLFDRHFENIYKEAQESWGIQFIRGRLSEVNEDMNGQLVVRVEDTLSHRPMKLSLDLLVLMVGMVPSKETEYFADKLNLKSSDDRFIMEDNHVLTAQNMDIRTGVFVAGTAKGPSTIKETIADAKSVAINAHFYIKHMLQ